jgi:hypothetical protein
MSDDFNDPGTGGDRIDFKELTGALLLFDVLGVEENIPTTFGDKPAVRADVAVLDGPLKGTTYKDTLVFPLVMIGQLKRSVGGRVIGRVEQGNAKPAQNAPWQLATASDTDKDIGRRYIQYVAAQAAPVIDPEEPF